MITRILSRARPYDRLELTVDGEKYVFTEKKLLQAAKTYRALLHRFRQDILRLLSAQGPMTVSQILREMRKKHKMEDTRATGTLEQSVISQHLAILREAGFVTRERSGRNNYYRLNPQKFQEVAEYLQKLIWSPPERRRRRS